MTKKVFIVFAISLLVILLGTYSFATENMMNKDNIKNTIMNAENSVANGVTSAINSVKNTANDAMNSMENGMNDMTQNTNDTNNENNSTYNVTRTDATTQTRVAGMTATSWTWLIIAVLGVAIVALVWYFARQYTDNHSHND